MKVLAVCSVVMGMALVGCGDGSELPAEPVKTATPAADVATLRDDEQKRAKAEPVVVASPVATPEPTPAVTVAAVPEVKVVTPRPVGTVAPDGTIALTITWCEPIPNYRIKDWPSLETSQKFTTCAGVEGVTLRTSVHRLSLADVSRALPALSCGKSANGDDIDCIFSADFHRVVQTDPLDPTLTEFPQGWVVAKSGRVDVVNGLPVFIR